MMRTTVRRLCGQDSGWPSPVLLQSKRRRRSPTSPPPRRNVTEAASDATQALIRSAKAPFRRSRFGMFIFDRSAASSKNYAETPVGVSVGNRPQHPASGCIGMSKRGHCPTPAAVCGRHASSKAVGNIAPGSRKSTMPPTSASGETHPCQRNTPLTRPRRNLNSS